MTAASIAMNGKSPREIMWTRPFGHDTSSIHLEKGLAERKFLGAFVTHHLMFLIWTRIQHIAKDYVIRRLVPQMDSGRFLNDDKYVTCQSHWIISTTFKPSALILTHP
ncbi:hypothetical protein CDL15_Pgr022865 [Punica granatum]|uniref:Uncharacterized protein n=1 Tax=Punica granatum TaxID=22663 RepID=A0A218X3F6_PUNGR|nr:hypothetical protein CDL15_Pgr022865 [Punica granatum]PKI65746.1 hypothetical protein CRG98_013818 [Punica granatum]